MPDYKIHTYSHATDKSLYSLAQKELGNGSRWTEFLVESKPNNEDWIKPTQKYDDGVRVKIPVVSETFALADDMNVRTSIDTIDLKNLIYTADNKTKFKYGGKSSLVKDTTGRVWAEVTLDPPKDKAGKPYAKGWICVKDATTYYTAEKIDMPVPTVAKIGKG